jgi:hypothetical protein
MVEPHLMHSQCDVGNISGNNILDKIQNSNGGNNVFSANEVVE